MALVLKDRVKETTTVTGTGAVTLDGAVTGFQTFATALSDGDTTFYAVSHRNAAEWEVGVGTFTSGDIVRTTILESSNSGSAVNFSAGTKDVFLTYPAEKAVVKQADESVELPDDLSVAGDLTVTGAGTVTGVLTASDDVTVAGSLDVAESIEVETHIDLKTTTANKPAHAEGRLFYDEAFGALAVYNDEADITLQVGQEEYIRVKNNSGATITNGTPVYLTGEDANTPTIAVARADGTYSASQAVGIATHDIENNTVGYVTVRGLIADVDTSHLTVGERVHVAVGASGGTQTAAPSYPYFATDVGICLISSASGGCIYVYVETHAFETLRVTDNAHFDSNVTIDGDLTVLGTQTIANSNNISLAGAFNYFNSGNTIGDANTTFTGTGLDDAILTGHYEGTTTNKTFYVKIDATGTPDTFSWSTDNFSTTKATGVAITGADQTLEDGISVEFNATTGHTVGDIWSGSASPVNVDSGIASNRNTGGTGIGYTHMGMYYDVSTNKWTFFDEYDPEPTGTIDTTHGSFSYGTVKADTFEGTLDGNVTGDVTGNLVGSVTGTVSSLSNHDTGDLAEGSNLYYTAARVNSAIDTRVDTAFVDALDVDAETLGGSNKATLLAEAESNALALSIALG